MVNAGATMLSVISNHVSTNRVSISMAAARYIYAIVKTSLPE